jgi:hypothetical protein
LDGADLLGEAVGHREKIRRINIGGDVSSEASHSLGGQFWALFSGAVVLLNIHEMAQRSAWR